MFGVAGVFLTLSYTGPVQRRLNIRKTLPEDYNAIPSRSFCRQSGPDEPDRAKPLPEALQELEHDAGFLTSRTPRVDEWATPERNDRELRGLAFRTQFGPALQRAPLLATAGT